MKNKNDFIICLECNEKVKRIYGKHLKESHGGMTSAEYKILHPGAPLQTESDKKIWIWRAKTPTSSTNVASLSNTGNFTASGEVTAYSDRILKSDIETIDKISSLDKVMKLRPVSYIKNDKRSIGLIAQEVREISPELVHGNEDEGYLSLNYAQSTALLISAMQKQQEMIYRLERRISDLENNY